MHGHTDNRGTLPHSRRIVLLSSLGILLKTPSQLHVSPVPVGVRNKTASCDVAPQSVAALRASVEQPLTTVWHAHELCQDAAVRC